MLTQLEQQQTPILNSAYVYNAEDLRELTKVNLVFYDEAKGIVEKQKAQEMVDKLRYSFKKYENKIVPINSSKPEQMTAWENYITKKYFMNLEKLDPFVKIVNEESKQVVEQIVNDILMKYVVPYIEGRLVTLYNQYLSTNKSSLGDTFKKYFKSKVEAKSLSAGYKMNQREYLFRQIADIFFMIEDYDQAAQFYRQIYEEFRNKSYIHYANCLEYYIISMIMQLKDNLSISKSEFSNIFNLLKEAGMAYFANKSTALMIRTTIYQVLIQYMFD